MAFPIVSLLFLEVEYDRPSIRRKVFAFLLYKILNMCACMRGCLVGRTIVMTHMTFVQRPDQLN